MRNILIGLVALFVTNNAIAQNTPQTYTIIGERTIKLHSTARAAFGAINKMQIPKCYPINKYSTGIVAN
jgi:hypothetical protein